MRGSVAKVALLDSCFWIALLNDKDGDHTSAVDLYEKIETWHALVPWPTLYEVISTKTTRDNRRLIRFGMELRSPGIQRIDDSRYREVALERTLSRPDPSRTLSLVDEILRDMLADVNLRIDSLVTYNYRDFDDVCRRRGVPILPRDAEA